MKKELFALLLLLGLGIGACFNLRHLRQFTDSLSTQLDSIHTAAQQENWDSAAAESEALLDRWTAANGYTHIFIRHSEIDSMTDAICALISAAYGSDAGELEGNYRNVSEKLHGLYGMERLTPGSIL